MRKINQLLATALAATMVVSALPMQAAATGTLENPATCGNVTMSFGDTATPTFPEANMYFDATSAGVYEAVYSTDGANESTTYYPEQLSLYLTGDIDSITGTDIQFATYASDGTPTYSTTADADDGFYTVCIGSADASLSVDADTDFVINFDAPFSQSATSGAAPTYINGYLPIGQYCNGKNPWAAAWGNIFSDTEQTTTRLTSGYATQGVSLGAAGGYVQMEFATPIGNDADNPYGIDFVVYGNAFKNNPEAASVKVSNDGVTWYELAGSLYYAEDTMHNVDVSYTVGSDDKIDYALNDGATKDFGGTVNWFPTTDFYSAMTGITTAVAGTVAVNEATLTASELTYENVTLVKDTDDTDDYLFGYADIRPVGNTIDGTACNPYASLPSTQTTSASGGDGFDLSWAVDANGTPVNLAQAQYVRIYSSAALDATGEAFTVPSMFGETSAEVCGVYVAQGDTGSETTESALQVNLTASGMTTTVSTANMGSTTDTMTKMNANIFGATTATISVANTTADNIFINGVSVEVNDTVEIDLTSDLQNVQIITQTGNEEPYITVVQLG